MAVRKSDSKHECSCGRSFRHAISLRRHQNVTGCSPKTQDSKSPSDAPAVSPPSENSAREPEPAIQVPQLPPMLVNSPIPRASITPQQVAEWQKQWQEQPESTKQNWNEFREETKQNLKACALGACQAASGLRWLATAGARCLLFLALVVALGWSVLFGLSRHLEAAPAPVSQQMMSEMAARTMVEDLLTLGRLGQFQRAHGLLTPSARERVDTARLATVLNGLPLHQSPSSYRVQTLDQHTIEVSVLRAAAREVYTVSRDQSGWGLSGISLREL